jgi:TetR/AcrR family transcriptional repressor of nem operon
VEYQTGEVLGAQRRLLEDLDGFEALERWRDMMIAAQDARECTGGCPLGSMVGDLAETDPQSRGDLAAAFKAWEVLIADGLRSLQTRGVLPEHCDTGKLALSLLSSVQGGLILSQLHRNTDPLRAALDNEIAHLREIAAAGTSA